MKYLYTGIFAVFFLSLTSCNSEVEDSIEQEIDSFMFYVEPPTTTTRAYANTDLFTIGSESQVAWEMTDELSVYAEGYPENNRFVIEHIDQAPSQNIAAIKPADNTIQKKDANFYYVIYPYVSGNNYDVNKQCFNISINSVQHPREKTFDIASTFYGGKTSKGTVSVSLLHVCGFFKVTLPDGWKRFTITNPDETDKQALSGDISLTLGIYGPNLKTPRSSYNYSVSIEPRGTKGEAGTYLISVIPGNYTSGLQLTAELQNTTKTRNTKILDVGPGTCWDLGNVRNPE